MVMAATVDASGDFGDFGKAPTKLSEDFIATYYTEDKVVGRDMEQGQCSELVLRQRQKTMENVRESAHPIALFLTRSF